jgi:hypothetical protein
MFSDYTDFLEAVTDYKVNQALSVEPDDPQEVEDSRRFQASINADGTWKSLGHSLSYFNELPTIPKGAPDPFRYSADQQEQFESDLSAWKTGAMVYKGVKQAIGPDPREIQAQQVLEDQVEDDPNGPKRRELDELAMDFSKKAIIARRNNDKKTEELANWHLRSIEREIESLGDSPATAFLKEAEEAQEQTVADQLFDETLIDKPEWDTPRFKTDAPIQVVKANRLAKKYLRLPVEDAPFGNVQQCKPGNMVMFDDLPKDVLEELKRAGTQGSQEPNDIFRRQWNLLHRKGYAALEKKPVAGREPTEAEKAEKPVKEKKSVQELDRMTQKQYNAHMNRLEQERRRGPLN